MCFSIQADLVVGSAAVGLGALAWHDARRAGDRALALLPLVFGGHLLLEALVWRGVHGQLSASVDEFAVRAYLAIAFVVVPVLVPAVLARVDRPERRWRYLPFLILGIAVAAVLAWPVAAGEVSASDGGLHVAYHVDLSHAGLVVGLYVVATCAPALLASDRRIRTFGVANLIAVFALALIEREALVSLWCAWAAITSVAIAHRAHQGRREGAELRPGPGTLHRS